MTCVPAQVASRILSIGFSILSVSRIHDLAQRVAVMGVVWD
jgi:hypothetical protein